MGIGLAAVAARRACTVRPTKPRKEPTVSASKREGLEMQYPFMASRPPAKHRHRFRISDAVPSVRPHKHHDRSQARIFLSPAELT